jgi:hypothetical protein
VQSPRITTRRCLILGVALMALAMAVAPVRIHSVTRPEFIVRSPDGARMLVIGLDSNAVRLEWITSTRSSDGRMIHQTSRCKRFIFR